MNSLVAVACWSGWYWRAQCDSIALLSRAVAAKRCGDMIAHRKYLAAARAAEGRLLSLVAALEAFCHRSGIDVSAALAAAGVDRSWPALDVARDLDYQRAVEAALASLSAPLLESLPGAIRRAAATAKPVRRQTAANRTTNEGN